MYNISYTVLSYKCCILRVTIRNHKLGCLTKQLFRLDQIDYNDDQLRGSGKPYIANVKGH